jgi:hypothetical protein
MFLPVSKTAALVQSELGAVRALADKSARNPPISPAIRRRRQRQRGCEGQINGQ